MTKKLQYGIILILVAMISSCEMIENPFSEEDDSIFIIEAGSHDSGNHFEDFQGNTLTFKATFDQSAKYATSNPSNQGDINKLMGFSDCNGHHHENSARFGWRWFDDKLEIFAYYYIDGELNFEKMGNATLNEPEVYSINKDSDKYTFRFKGKTFKVNRNSCDGNLNYVLYPYFGGDEKAPQDIRIEIERIVD